ncbi:MAG: helix-turn-helix domain-containing protein [Myxococcota bacterium]|jgi:sugar-specific transcriptional regulator TrmB
MTIQMVKVEDVSQILGDLGFSAYESKAYCTLLQQYPLNGYNIAKASGIPRAKIYETLEKLLSKGFIVRVESAGADSRMFAPVDPDFVIQDIEDTVGNRCGKARELLKGLQKNTSSFEVLWRVTSQEDLIRRGIILARKAIRTLHVALWDHEFDALKDLFLESMDRGVKIALILYSRHEGLKSLQDRGAGAILHSASKLQYLPVLGRQFVLVSDREDCITGSIFSDSIVEGVYTKNRGLVTNAVDLVNHEIYLERILETSGEAVTACFGPELERLDAFDPVTHRG